MLLPHTHLTFLALLLAHLTLLHPCPAHAAPPSISFHLYDTDTARRVRQLRSNSIISVPYNYTVVAHVAPTPTTLTFTRPFHHVERRIPFTLSGDWSPGPFGTPNYQPLRLHPARFALSAYANNYTSSARTLTNLTFLAPLGPPALLGPLPTEIIPQLDPPAAPVPAPPRPPFCTLPRPNLEFESWEESWYALASSDMGYILTWCRGAPLRKRLLEYVADPQPNGTFSQMTRVLWAIIEQTYDDAVSLLDQVEQVFCSEKRVFLEFCAAHPKSADELCTTSQVVTLPPRSVQTPRLLFRPPRRLLLAPGDRALVHINISEWPQNTVDPFWNGATSKNKTYILWGAVETALGFVNVTTPAEGQQMIVVPVPLHAHAVTKEDDATLVYLQYAEVDCPGNIAHFRHPWATEIVVDHSISSLVRQDTHLPHISAIVYPRTALGEPVQLEATVTNTGGGMRADGNPTELTLQWYLRTRKFEREETYPSPIPGANGPTLYLKESICDAEHCYKTGGCSGLARYSLEACNSYGCARSNEVLPNVFIPPGMSWYAFDCTPPQQIS